MIKPNKDYFKHEHYSRYTTQQNVDDVWLNSKVKWYENLPLIGSIFYLIRISKISKKYSENLYKKVVYKWKIIFMFTGLLFVFLIFLLLSPWVYFLIIKIAINETQNILSDPNNNLLED